MEQFSLDILGLSASLPPATLLIYSHTHEERSEPAYLASLPSNIASAQIIEAGTANNFSIQGMVVLDSVSVFNKETLLSAFSEFDRIVLDITGLSTPIWARLVQLFSERLIVLYTAPSGYKRPHKGEDDYHEDLTETISGLGGLPGFRKTTHQINGRTVLIALLGFEGARFSLFANQYTEFVSEIYPIVGAPGYSL